MASAQSYPSPTQQQMASGYGPFYGHQNGAQSPPPHEVPDDLQLRAELSRSLAPILNHPPPEPHHQPSHVQAQHYDDGQHDDSQLAQDLLGFNEHQASPIDQHGQDTASKDKSRSKVSRACDECRRKKARQLVISSASKWAIADGCADSM